MYDLNAEFNKFCNDHVTLQGEVQTKLFKQARLNIDRLKEGLDEYNEENDTSYKVRETHVQGSMAMHTAVQNDSKDYDIDVAIIFDRDNIGKNMGSRAIKNVVLDALKRKCTGFKNEPEAKTNCIRIEYTEGYHIDFAVYRHWEDALHIEHFEHAGSNWALRDPKAINQWFRQEIKLRGQHLRKVIRLSKMLCKSREDWVMPGGLIQTVLLDERFVKYDRLDECFYYTIKSVRDRLNINIAVFNPADKKMPLLLKEKDCTRVRNYLNRLDSHIAKMEPLFDDDCTRKTAMSIWEDFFQHDFWHEEDNNLCKSFAVTEARHYNTSRYTTYNDTEEFIEDRMECTDRYKAKISCMASGNGFLPHPLSFFINKGWLPHNLTMTFTVKHNVPGDVEIFWKVKNVGETANLRNNIRGQIVKGKDYITEHTNFYGPHYVECFIVKNGTCVARDRIDVPIDR